MIQLIGGSASSPAVPTCRGAGIPPAGVGDLHAGELVLTVQCNRKRCGRSWRLRPGQQIPASCPGCEKFDW